MLVPACGTLVLESIRKFGIPVLESIGNFGIQLEAALRAAWPGAVPRSQANTGMVQSQAIVSPFIKKNWKKLNPLLISILKMAYKKRNIGLFIGCADSYTIILSFIEQYVDV